MKWTGLLICLCLPLSLFAGAPPVPDEYRSMINPVDELMPERMEYWAKQYQGKCARCHGEYGDAGGADYPSEPGIPDPVSFKDKAFMDSKSDGELFYQIEMGGEDYSDMPDFGPDSSHGWDEDKIWEMVYFIRQFAR